MKQTSMKGENWLKHQFSKQHQNCPKDIRSQHTEKRDMQISFNPQQNHSPFSALSLTTASWKCAYFRKNPQHNKQRWQLKQIFASHVWGEKYMYSHCPKPRKCWKSCQDIALQGAERVYLSKLASTNNKSYFSAGASQINLSNGQSSSKIITMSSFSKMKLWNEPFRNYCQRNLRKKIPQL